MKKVVLFVIDGLSNRLLEALLREGKLPTFKKLIKNGVKNASFDLHEGDPWVNYFLFRREIKNEHGLGSHSRVPSWTTLSTGTLPMKHGVISDTEPNAQGLEFPISRKNRKKRAMWEIISQYNKKIGTIGWIADWPPVKVPEYTIVRMADMGIHVSAGAKPCSYENFSLDKDFLSNNPVYPDWLWKELKKIHFDSKIKNFSPWAKSTEWAFSALVRDTIEDSLYLEWAKFLLKRFPQPDFLTICLYQIHSLSHLFWDCLKIEKAHFKGFSHENRQKRFGSCIEDRYQYLDREINEILKLIEGHSIVMIVSPYGMRRSRVTKKYLHLNALYEKLGLLKYNAEGIDWKKTKVYDNLNPWGIFPMRKGFIKDSHPEILFVKLKKSLEKIKTEQNEKLFLEMDYEKKDRSFNLLPNYRIIHYATKIFLDHKYFFLKKFIDFIPHYSVHSPKDLTVIISGKDIRDAKIIKSRMTTLDIAPMVLSFLGIKYQDKDMLGKPIFEF
ncbi:MAG: hypothetical protein AMJ95_02430 [Omnitrophica WOR_2 bacterium SM23_72]|nr:MAG: hypothetical protein AMJ95_02430 [Omnitrophica WOR_2 bacterium SM23_72]